MSEQESIDSSEDIPWQQRLYQRVWLLAVLAVLFWLVSYVGWGLFDIMTTPGG